MWLQPDSLVPNPGRSNDFDRFGFVRNNPIRYVDPTGHTSVCAGANGDPECYDSPDKWMPSLSQMGITLVGQWTPQDVGRIQKEAAAIALTLLELCGGYCSGRTSYQIFNQVFGNRTINLSQDGSGAGCEVLNCSQGTGGWLGTDHDAQGLVIHEFGHIFDHRISGQWGYGRNVLGGTTIHTEIGRYVEGIPDGGGAWERRNDGYRGDDYPYQQHPLSVDGGDTAGEDFADMFMNFVLDYSGIYNDGGFAPDQFGRARYAWMSSYMPTWVPWMVQR